MAILRRHAMYLVSALTATAVCGCSYGGKKGTVTEAEPVTVKVMPVKATGGISSFSYVGTVQASKSTVISSSYPGTLVRLDVRSGQQVNTGDTIGYVYSQSIISMNDMAEATLSQARDGYNRAGAVHRSGSIADVKWVEIQTQLAKAEASAKAARQALDDCTLTAPYSGIIGDVYADEGVDVTASAPIARLMDISSVEAGFPVPESEINSIMEGMTVSVSVPALRDTIFSGVIKTKGISASVLSHCYTCTLIPDGHIPGLLPGMVCKVRIGRGAESIVIPASTVRIDVNGKYVWTVRNGRVAKTPVITGDFAGNGVTVLSGLTAGDTLITAGARKVSSGMAVKTVE